MFWNKDNIPNEDDLFTLDDNKEAFIEEEKEIKSNYEEVILSGSESLKTKKINKILSLLLILTIIFSSMILIDVIATTRFNVGPFFAIRVKKHNDGGTKEYLGLGYKVIKYRENLGRYDLVVGNWSLQYNTTAIKTTNLDLAIEFNNDIKKATNKYLNKYLEVEGKVSSVNKDKITLKYNDEENKYTTIVKCNLLNNKKLEKKDKVTIVGTLYDYDNNNNLVLKMKNCYIK